MNVLPACSVLALLAALPAGIALAAPDPALCPPAPARADRVFRVAQADTAAAPDEAAHNKAPPDEARIAAELSDLLQACSYDGSRLTVAAKALQGAAEGDGGAVVASIMKFTGLAAELPGRGGRRAERRGGDPDGAGRHPGAGDRL